MNLRAGGAAALLAALAVASPLAFGAEPDRRVSPYAATPDSVVEAMLKLARVGPDDFVVDLGSGDGRLVIAAARRFGARGLGVDIDAKLVEYAQRAAEREGVADRARFREQDLFETDLRDATVVTIYLLPQIMPRVAKKLEAELRPGTRVVAHDFQLPGWRIERLDAFDVPEKRDYTFNTRSTIYLYRVPARAARE